MSLIDSNDQTDLAEFENQKPITGGESIMVLMNLKRLFTKNEPNLKFVSRCLTNFIRHNTKIQHINLESCNIGE